MQGNHRNNSLGNATPHISLLESESPPECGTPQSLLFSFFYLLRQAGEDIEWYSRVTGYYSRVRQWNKGQVREFHDRKRYNY